MIVVGITGGIASGKSFVTSYLKKLKIPFHDSDVVVRSVYKEPTNKFLIYLIKNGFKEVVHNKKINKTKIREEIFLNKKKKEVLESFLHNEVKKQRQSFVKKKKKEKIIFLDIPLLFEKKLQSECDYICSVIAPLKIREQRALKREGINKKTFNLIIKNQVRDSFRIKHSHYIIKTSLDKKHTCLQIDKIIYDILNK